MADEKRGITVKINADLHADKRLYTSGGIKALKAISLLYSGAVLITLSAMRFKLSSTEGHIT